MLLLIFLLMCYYYHHYLFWHWRRFTFTDKTLAELMHLLHQDHKRVISKNQIYEIYPHLHHWRTTSSPHRNNNHLLIMFLLYLYNLIPHYDVDFYNHNIIFITGRMKRKQVHQHYMYCYYYLFLYF